MSTKELSDCKRIASEQVVDRPVHLGTDETGAEHYWSIYEQTAVVVEPDGEVVTQKVGHRPLSDWELFVAECRGWQDAPNVGSAILAGSF